MMQGFRRMIKDPKQRVALSSVVAAIFLITLKLYVGIITSSLGILSEALHSTLDFVAATITMMAVVSASRPADLDHHFGHGKSENLSAMVETILLLATCLWIFYEAYERIFVSHQFVEANIAAFGTMAISIIVDASRSRVLYQAAKQYKSQALEADALHFSSDILSSSVVIVGLISVSLGFPLGDSLGAIGVGILVLVVSLRLGRRTLDFLMDKAPVGETDAIRKRVESVEGVKVERIRIRSAGPYHFVDLKISLDRNMTLDSSRLVVSKVETRIEEILGSVDIAVQVEPRIIPDENLSSKINLIASKEEGVTHVHGIRLYKVDNEIIAELHLEVDPNITVKEAHEIVSDFESRVKSELGIKEITTHIETHEKEGKVEEDRADTSARITKRIRKIVSRYPEIADCHEILVRKIEGKISVIMHCRIPANQSIIKAHELATSLENVVRAELKDISSVTIHVEPKDAA